MCFMFVFEWRQRNLQPCKCGAHGYPLHYTLLTLCYIILGLSAVAKGFVLNISIMLDLLAQNGNLHPPSQKVLCETFRLC